MITLFVNWYVDKSSKRNDENRTCLQINLANPLIDKICLMCDDEAKDAAPKHHKIEIEECITRPKYDDFFKAINKLGVDINIIANSDIYFDETLSAAFNIDDDHCYALTRWDDVGKEKVFLDAACSQDVWIFKGELKDIYGDFELGRWACDGRIAHEIEKAGYIVQNPSKTIRAIHLHRGRTPAEVLINPNPDKTIPPPYKNTFPCRLEEVNNIHLAIGIPCSWTHVPAAFFDTFIQMEKPDFVYIPAKNGPIDEMRDYIVARASQSGCTHLLMLDVDQTYPKDTITKLLQHDKDVVHARVYRRYPPFDALMFEIDGDGYKEKLGYKSGDLVEVDACGAGCVLYNMKVFNDIKQPWFEFVRDGIGDKIGEDVNFCRKLKAKVFKIFVDTSIPVKHLGMTEVDESFSFLYRKLMENQMKRDAGSCIKQQMNLF